MIPSRPIRLAAAVAARDWPRARQVMQEATAADSDGAVAQVDETLLQCYLFLGFPAAIEAFSAWREIHPRQPIEDEGLPSASAPVEDRRVRGEEVCRQVYGSSYDKLRDHVAGLHPALDRWMITEGYGKVLGRPRLGLDERELCVVAILTVAGWPRQLHSHLRGALNVGADEARVEAALESGLELATDPTWVARARQIWSTVRHRHASTGA